VDYITKPIRHQEVFARVQAHLTIRKLQQELQEKNITLEKYVALLTEKNAQLEEKNVQLDEKNLQLQEANTSKDRFFSIISHDLRAPFVGLLGLTQIVVEEFETYTRDEIKNMLVNLQETSRTLYTLLGNLLTWSRIQRGMIENNPQEMDVQEVIVRNVRLFNSNAEQKQITLKNLLHELTVVYADERMVHTIIRNLISNAVKFTHPGGNVTVSAEQEENTVTVSVSDTGIGIGEKHIPKLFRIDAKYKRPGTAEEQGTGLGLVLCKEFVERSGGKIWVESTIDKGTTFRFTLPKKPVE
jgi:two-component system sensor histidine kinase/response regulator